MSSTYLVTEDEAALAEVIEQLSQQDRYALDTEFHRERTYFPELALVQIAWDNGLVLIDPLAVDVTALTALFELDATAVIHAASQDLEVLEYAVGMAPMRMFDTQIGASFLGLRTPSLSALTSRYLGVEIPKANRLTDWMTRPLERAQLEYAASDVERLLEIHDLIIEGLTDRGRLEWARDECEQLRIRGTMLRDPEDAWLRIKECRSLGGKARGAAKAIADWRERTAQQRNIPVRRVVSDLAVVSLAQRRPTKPRDFERVRGLERRSLGRNEIAELIEAIDESASAPPPVPQKARKKGPVDVRPAVTLITAWLTQYARDLEIDPQIVGSRADIEEFVRGETSKLSTGWRHDTVGEQMLALFEGKAAVAFDGEGRVTIERRSHQPLDLAQRAVHGSND